MFSFRCVSFSALFNDAASVLLNTKHGGMSQTAPGALDASANGMPSLAFIKMPKTGGSTFSGILRRIGKKHGYGHVHDGPWLRDGLEEAKGTSVWGDHGVRAKMGPRIDAYLSNPVYMTSVRDPVSRCMSAYYHFEVGRRGADPGDATGKEQYASSCGGDFQFRYMRQSNDQSPRQAFEAYDLVLVTERFDESLLALKRLLAARGLNVSGSDLLYLKSKKSGTEATGDFDRKAHGANFSMPVHRDISNEPAQVQHALQVNVAGGEDADIFHRAQAVLDEACIPSSELTAFQERLRLVEEQCGHAAGKNCLWNDAGCGQSCIDGMVSQNAWD